MWAAAYHPSGRRRRPTGPAVRCAASPGQAGLMTGEDVRVAPVRRHASSARLRWATAAGRWGGSGRLCSSHATPWLQPRLPCSSPHHSSSTRSRTLTDSRCATSARGARSLREGSGGASRRGRHSLRTWSGSRSSAHPREPGAGAPKAQTRSRAMPTVRVPRREMPQALPESPRSLPHQLFVAPDLGVALRLLEELRSAARPVRRGAPWS